MSPPLPAAQFRLLDSAGGGLSSVLPRTKRDSPVPELVTLSACVSLHCIRWRRAEGGDGNGFQKRSQILFASIPPCPLLAGSFLHSLEPYALPCAVPDVA